MDTLRDVLDKTGIELFRDWWSDSVKQEDREKDQERVRAVIGRFLVERAIDVSTRRKRSYSECVAHILSLHEFADIPEKSRLLGLLPFGVDKPLLQSSKELISLKWTAENFLAIGEYEPEDRDDFRGVSLVLSFSYPDWLHTALHRFFEPLRTLGLVNETTQHHLTVLSISPAIRKAEAYSFASEFLDRWSAAKREDKRLEETVRHVEQAAKIRIDELALLRDGAVVMFGSTSGGFMRSIMELRLMLLRGLFRDFGLEKCGWEDHRQPIWAQTVFARKSAQPSVTVLNAMPPWRPPRDRKRMRLEGARLSLLVFPDRKAQMKSDIIPL